MLPKNTQHLLAQITVIIATKNRTNQLHECLRAIKENTYKDFEIILVDQGENRITQAKIQEFQFKRVTHIVHQSGGKTAALNVAISKAQGAILAFTDDDCIVTPLWLESIVKNFRTDLNISAIFGKTKPYDPQNHRDKICPSLFLHNTRTLITKPSLHYKNIGFGNNMAVRAHVFKTTGLFMEWLGPGSIGSNAEDAELALRLLICGQSILYLSLIHI